jgi:hypothetical protein
MLSRLRNLRAIDFLCCVDLIHHLTNIFCLCASWLPRRKESVLGFWRSEVLVLLVQSSILRSQLWCWLMGSESFRRFCKSRNYRCSGHFLTPHGGLGSHSCSSPTTPNRPNTDRSTGSAAIIRLFSMPGSWPSCVTVATASGMQARFIQS